MRPKLTKEIVNERLADREIRLVGEFTGTLNKSLFTCKKRHTWEAKPGSVTRGSGCPHCAGLAPLTKAIVSERIADREILLLGDFTNTKTKTLFECKQKHTWEARPSTVMAGHGCPFCAGRTQP